MTKDVSKGDCSGPLSDLCVKGKIEFARDNQTHLLLVKIFHTTVNDSGQYAVWTRFYSGNFHDDEKTAKCLKVINVKVEGKECMCHLYYQSILLLFPIREQGDVWGYQLFYSQEPTTLNCLRLWFVIFRSSVSFRSFRTNFETSRGVYESFWLCLVTAMIKHISKTYYVTFCTAQLTERYFVVRTAVSLVPWNWAFLPRKSTFKSLCKLRRPSSCLF